jgi:LemA protein
MVYQRRADLIRNLVNTVSGAANFRKSTLVEVTNARASVGRVQMQLDPKQSAGRPPHNWSSFKLRRGS